eukprot:349565-Amphidinium_carterae.1
MLLYFNTSAWRADLGPQSSDTYMCVVCESFSPIEIKPMPIVADVCMNLHIFECEAHTAFTSTSGNGLHQLLYLVVEVLSQLHELLHLGQGRAR